MQFIYEYIDIIAEFQRGQLLRIVGYNIKIEVSKYLPLLMKAILVVLVYLLALVGIKCQNNNPPSFELSFIIKDAINEAA